MGHLRLDEKLPVADYYEICDEAWEKQSYIDAQADHSGGFNLCIQCLEQVNLNSKAHQILYNIKESQ